MLSQKDAKKFRKDCKKFLRKIRSKKDAQKVLIKLGTHNPDGTIHKNYS